MFNYDDIFLEGYYDALFKNEEEHDEYDELEEAYLEGYYTALMEQGNAENRAKRRKLEVNNAKNSNFLSRNSDGNYVNNYAYNGKTERKLKAGSYLTYDNGYGKQHLYPNKKKSNPGYTMPQTFPVDISYDSYKTLAKMSRNRADNRNYKIQTKSQKLSNALDKARKEGRIHKGLSDPNSSISKIQKNKSFKRGFSDV